MPTMLMGGYEQLYWMMFAVTMTWLIVAMQIKMYIGSLAEIMVFVLHRGRIISSSKKITKSTKYGKYYGCSRLTAT